MPDTALADDDQGNGDQHRTWTTPPEYSLEPYWGQRFACHTNVPGDPGHSSGCQQWSESEDLGTGAGPFTHVDSVTKVWYVGDWNVISDSDCYVSYIQPEPAAKAIHYTCDSFSHSNPWAIFDLHGGTHGRIDVKTGDYRTSFITGSPPYSGLIAEVICTPDPDCVDPQPTDPEPPQ
jgi:hypothetical protein